MRIRSALLHLQPRVKSIVLLIGCVACAGTPRGAWAAPLTGTSLVLTSSANPVLLSNPITLQATVASSSGTPSGSIAFYDGVQLLGSVPLESNGIANLSVTIGTMGAHPLTAAYSGDASFAGEISAAVPEIVEDFVLSPPVMLDNNTCQCHLPVGTSIYSFSISPLGGATLPSTIMLSLSGLPSGTTGTLTPMTVAAGAGTIPVILTLQKQAVASQQVPAGPQGTFILALSLMIPSIMGWRRRKRRDPGLRTPKLVAWLVIWVLVSVGAAGCGSANGTPAASSTTQVAPAYSIIITATGGSLQHTATVTVTTI